jgi:SAM-dependent methyltransferase
MQTALESTTTLARRTVGTEARKTFEIKLADGFVQRYLCGSNILDIGYKGYTSDALTIVPQAIGIDLDYPGYDGRILPFSDASQDAVYSSHCLEHIADYRHAIGEWFRVLKPGGYLIIVVPHQFLYEKRTGLPSRWNEDHKRFYTPASLMAEIERSLLPNAYRLRHLVDNDLDYDYAIGPPTACRRLLRDRVGDSETGSAGLGVGAATTAALEAAVLSRAHAAIYQGSRAGTDQGAASSAGPPDLCVPLPRGTEQRRRRQRWLNRLR